MLNDEYFMRIALAEAEKAFQADEVPVGAVITANEKIIARGYNMVEKLNDVTAHAEMLSFTSASSALNGKFLNDCVLYVTLEPCVMCAGASYWTRIGRIVFGAADLKRGFRLANPGILHPATVITGGVMEAECAALLKTYFAGKR